MTLAAILIDSVPDYQAALADQRKQALIELLERDPEGWSSLQGLLAMIRLPATDEGRQILEVERNGTWMAIDRVDVRRDGITFTKGHNGHSTVYTVGAGTPIPRWRIGGGSVTHMIPHYI